MLHGRARASAFVGSIARGGAAARALVALSPRPRAARAPGRGRVRRQWPGQRPRRPSSRAATRHPARQNRQGDAPLRRCCASRWWDKLVRTWLWNLQAAADSPCMPRGPCRRALPTTLPAPIDWAEAVTHLAQACCRGAASPQAPSTRKTENFPSSRPRMITDNGALRSRGRCVGSHCSPSSPLIRCRARCAGAGRHRRGCDALLSHTGPPLPR